MDRDLILLAVAMACGGNSHELRRWLSEPFASVRDLHSPARQRRARIRDTSAANLDQLLQSEQLAQTAQQLRDQGWRLIEASSDLWPPLLQSLDDAPPLLFVLGDATVLQQPQLAMVGARHASVEGIDNARRFARTLARAGFVITSGLALGIDRAAHEGALRGGTTIAVLGHGPGPCYPKRNQALAAEIVAGGGALVTEFPPHCEPRREYFPQRNRLISGLSLATIVVEAAEHSGSLITARCAARQGREVFAIPGSIHNPLSKGCHRLLRDGANWLESVDDVLASFPSLTQLATASGEVTAPADPLLAHFTSGSNSIDQLHQRSGLDIASLTQALTRLELAGDIQRVPGGYCRRHPEQELP